MADPMLVEFLNSGIAYAIDHELDMERVKKLKKVHELVRGDHSASYIMGQADGLLLAISVLKKLRKQEGNDGQG